MYILFNSLFSHFPDESTPEEPESRPLSPFIPAAVLISDKSNFQDFMNTVAGQLHDIERRLHTLEDTSSSYQDPAHLVEEEVVMPSLAEQQETLNSFKTESNYYDLYIDSAEVELEPLNSSASSTGIAKFAIIANK
jgi:hypothetical protein